MSLRKYIISSDLWIIIKTEELSDSEILSRFKLKKKEDGTDYIDSVPGIYIARKDGWTYILEYSLGDCFVNNAIPSARFIADTFSNYDVLYSDLDDYWYQFTYIEKGIMRGDVRLDVLGDDVKEVGEQLPFEKNFDIYKLELFNEYRFKALDYFGLKNR